MLKIIICFLQTPYAMSRYNPATNRPPNVRIPGQVDNFLITCAHDHVLFNAVAMI